MNKFLIGIMAIIAVIVILGGLAALGAGIKDFRSELISDSFIVATNTTSTNGTIQLTHALFDADMNNVTTLASNLTTDLPVKQTYTSGNKVLLMGGLAANSTRTISVEYRSPGLDNYAGADTGIRFLPVIIVLAIIFIPLIVVYALVANR